MKKKERKINPYILFPILFFLAFAVYFGVSAGRHKMAVASGHVDIPQDAQTVEFMGISIGSDIFINDDELDQAVPYYFYIGGEWFAPEEKYPFTLWGVEGNTVFSGTEVVEEFTWTYTGTLADDVYVQIASDLSVDYGEASEADGVYTWTASDDHVLGTNDKIGSVELSRDDAGVYIHCVQK